MEKKGCEYLLRAMQVLQRAHPLTELTVIGDGPLRSSLEALAQELKIRCQFRGTQPPASVREALRNAKVFCVPSVTAVNGDCEGLPTVLAEAQAMGVPVVSTIHGGIPEIVVHGVNGLLVPERDHESLANALSILLSDEGSWQSFHHAALERIERHFDLADADGALEKIYNKSSRSIERIGISPNPAPRSMHGLRQLAAPGAVFASAQIYLPVGCHDGGYKHVSVVTSHRWWRSHGLRVDLDNDVARPGITAYSHRI